MPRVHHVKKARKPNPVVTAEDIQRASAGEEGAASYYWWKFRYGGKRFSKTPPARSQLTQSWYYADLYEIEDSVDASAAASGEDLEAIADDVAQRLEELRELCQENLDNMPEGLQESSSSGEMLQERIYACEDAAGTIQSLDVPDPEDGRDSNDWEADVDQFVEDIMDAISNCYV